MHIEEHFIDVLGFRTRYLTAGSGPVVILLHATGESAADWQWIIPVLARTHRVYAPDLFSYGETIPSDTDYSAEFFAHFVATFMTKLNIDRAAVFGNSLGGFIALHLALMEPSRVTALGLVDSVGLGREVHPALIMIISPVLGDIASVSSKTSPGARLRAWLRAPLLFANPWRIPKEWYREQYRIAQLPNFINTELKSARTQIDFRGQRTVLLNQLPRLEMPTLIIWGENDTIFPIAHARNALARLPNGKLELIPQCGHLTPVEQPERCAAVLRDFLIKNT